MTAPKRRADAIRNRERVLAAAYERFAADGFRVPIDQIAAGAGVGAGTVYRHFPTKNILIEAVVAHRLAQLATRAQRLMDTQHSAEAFFVFLQTTIAEGSADQGLAEAFVQSDAGSGGIAAESEASLMDVLDELVRAAQAAGAVRADIGAEDVKALVVGHQHLTRYRDDPTSDATLFDILRRGLAP